MNRILFVLALVLVSAVDVLSQTPFFQDKTIRIIAGYGAGSVDDAWTRTIARYLGKYIPGNPGIIVQNMPGAGAMIAANYVYKVAKPDGLTLGGLRAGLYFDQLVGKKEVQFDWSKFTWLGTPTQIEQLIYIRANSPYKNIQDVRKAAVPPKCGASGTASTGYYFGNLLEETIGAKFNTLTGYKDGPEVDLAVEREEIHCRGISIETMFGREPLIGWLKSGFVRVLIQTGKKRDPRLSDVPTIWELMNEYKTPDAGKTALDDHSRGRRVWPAVRCVPEHAAGPRKNPSSRLPENPHRCGFSGPSQRTKFGNQPRRRRRTTSTSPRSHRPTCGRCRADEEIAGEMRITATSHGHLGNTRGPCDNRGLLEQLRD